MNEAEWANRVDTVADIIRKNTNAQHIIDLSHDLGECIAEYKQRHANDETRLYACGPIPVDVTLPTGDHCAMADKVYCMYEYGNELNTVYERRRDCAN